MLRFFTSENARAALIQALRVGTLASISVATAKYNQPQARTKADVTLENNASAKHVVGSPSVYRR